MPGMDRMALVPPVLKLCWRSRPAHGATKIREARLQRMAAPASGVGEGAMATAIVLKDSPLMPAAETMHIRAAAPRTRVEETRVHARVVGTGAAKSFEANSAFRTNQP